MLIYVIAGEPSGDLLGGRLMAALRQATGDSIQFAGIGGENMQAQGLRSLFPMTELTVMGLTEVLPRIPRILRRVRETLDDIGRLQPDAILTIDSWGFTGRVQKGCQKRYPDLPRIHYVAPMVWAWKPKRAAKLAKVLDLLMTLLPFEPPYFEREGLRTIHVGHPVVESGAGQGDGAAFRARHGIADDVKLLAVLPGSRHSETSKLLPVFARVLERLKPGHQTLRVVVPTLPHLVDEVREATRNWPFDPVVIADSSQKYDCFAASTCALAASGTVALELAMAGLPTVIAYRLSALTAFIARNFFGFKIKWATLLNMVLDRPVMPEFLQEDCQAENIAPILARLLDDETEREWRRRDMAAGMAALGLGGASPGARAAQVVLDFIAQRKQP